MKKPRGNKKKRKCKKVNGKKVCGRKKKKNKKQKNKELTKQFSNCSDLTCLNNLVFSLKIEKDTIRNFLAQEKRIATKLRLMGMNE